MKLNFNVLTTLLKFCETGRTVAEMKHRLEYDYDAQLVKATIDYMIKQGLVTQTQSLVSSGRKLPITWIKNISLNCYAVKKAG